MNKSVFFVFTLFAAAGFYAQGSAKEITTSANAPSADAKEVKLKKHTVNEPSGDKHRSSSKKKHSRKVKRHKGSRAERRRAELR
jgi:hypothetical protein